LLSAVGDQHVDIQVHSWSCKQYNYHNFILLYGWIILHCVIHHIFFMHSSVVRHLGWFQSLLIMNSNVINVGVQACFSKLTYIPLHLCPRVV
jgi:hypothetical protein